MSRRPLRWLAGGSSVLVLATLVSPAPAEATSFVPLTADGSSWAEPAIDQWSKDVHGQGIVINYSGDGSATGRQHYIQDQADFASSDIAFLNTPDPFGAGTEASSYAYSYVPIVAGGTAFMYNLVVGGRKITDLRLSGLTLTKIFTGAITNWDDPAIAKDYGRALPSQKITPVTRSDGSGASYMLSQWMQSQYPTVWSSFCHAQGGGGSCGPTEFYPQFAGSVQRNGSDQVASYVSAGFGEGSIGYDEYAYALNNGISVVKVLNSAGYFTLPTPSNVAIALQAAIIDTNPASPTYLMQRLDNVYTYRDPRTYPLSSYNYLIVPRISRVLNGNVTGPPPRFSTAKGATLSTWMNYVLCGAQQKAGALGYSPLPKNLVVGGFTQMDQVPGHVATPNLQQLTGCNNPTYSDGTNHLIVDAPQPSPCDKVGTPLTCTVGNSGAGTGTGSSTRTGSTSGTGATGSAHSGGTGTGTGATTGRATTGTAAAGAGGGKVDPDTGVVANGDGSVDPQNAAAAAQYAVPVALAQPRSDRSWLLAGFTTLDIAAVIVLPGLFWAWLRKRRRITS